MMESDSAKMASSFRATFTSMFMGFSVKFFTLSFTSCGTQASMGPSRPLEALWIFLTVGFSSSCTSKGFKCIAS
eukprot:Skav217130  [mRNA]  locus=scaffold783:477562:482069:+ [translate_table: standard]